jgi:circadian clock protein KaiC
VIDSFKALHDISPSMSEMRRVVHDLAGLLTAYDTTAFLVGEYAGDQMATHPEFVVADGIVELLRHETGMRDDRFFRVRKLRGSSYREGLHALRLTAGGVKIFRRLVSPQVPRATPSSASASPPGSRGWTRCSRGGLWRGSTTLLGGPTGAGKTTIALQFTLEGVRQGEPGLYVHLEENPTQLSFLVEGFGTDPDTPGLHLLYHSPVELQIDSLVDEMFGLIRERG